MKRLVALALVCCSTVMAAEKAPPSPAQALGIEVGADRVLADAAETERYLRLLAVRSERIQLIDFGRSVEGRTMLAALISSPANLARAAELRNGWARLADPRGTTAAERERLIATLPSCALITAGIHATEVAGPQAALLFGHRLAAAPAGSEEAAWLERTVVLLVPSLNPDGQQMVAEWYRSLLGTPHEGAALPGLYHRYAGHDNNRDFVYLTQPESRALNRLAYLEWHPQTFLDLHQMGSSGPRQFVPPFADPIAANVHPLVWRTTSHLGTLMSLRLEERGRAGVISGWAFDGNWIGGTRNTGWWKNVFGVLTETASAALATPLHVDENELRGGGKGLVDYRAQVNFPTPRRCGRWGHSDAVAYQLDVMAAFVEFAAVNRRDVLANVATMALEAIARGEREQPRAYLVPPNPTDPARSRRLVDLLVEAGCEGAIAPGGAVADGLIYPPGTAVFPAAQPLRQYLTEVLERQRYPEISPAQGGEILLPYDITAWTMPLYLGTQVVRVENRIEGTLVPLARPPVWPPLPVAGRGSTLLLPAGQLAGVLAANRALERGGKVTRLPVAVREAGQALPPGSLVIAGLPERAIDDLAALPVTAVRAARAPALGERLVRAAVGVYHPDLGLEDAGWLRFVLEQAGFPVEVLRDQDVRGGLIGRVQVLVVPPLEGKTITDGPTRRGPVPMPARYQKGVGREGAQAITAFFNAGGTVIGFGPSADWLAELLDLPITNPLKGARTEDFYSPGALLTLDVDAASPLGWGMPPRLAVMIDRPSAFLTQPVAGEEQRTVVARFPDEPLLQSGWIRGEERLRRRAAVVEVRRGSGRAVLFSFAPFFRGQTSAAFGLLFNAVLAEMADQPGKAVPAAAHSPQS